MKEILPDSRLKETKNIVRAPHPIVNWLNWVPIFCANCGKDGGMVPEENCTFAFYLCEPCSEKWNPLMGTWMIPDEVFWQKVVEVQTSKEGLSPYNVQLLERESPYRRK